MEEPPVPPDADFSFKIEFKKGAGNPRRIFDAASSLIDAFEVLDKALIDSVDSNIEPVMVLEDVEASSLRVFLKNILTRTEDEALRTLDWKPLVGRYLVKAKYLVLEFLDDQSPMRPALSSLRAGLQRLARETDVRHLPDYAPIHEGRLLTALDRVQGAKHELDRDDKLVIESEGRRYEVDLSSDWEPSETLPVPSDTKETKNQGEVILTIRKPDFLKDTMWLFSFGKSTLSAPIHDEAWLARFHQRSERIAPGDALRCNVTWIYTYDEKGTLIDQRVEIDTVLEVIPGHGPQDDLI
jgi:hypothetical protein